MSGYFARIARRSLDAHAALQPVISRFSIALRDAGMDTLAQTVEVAADAPAAVRRPAREAVAERDLRLPGTPAGAAANGPAVPSAAHGAPGLDDSTALARYEYRPRAVRPNRASVTFAEDSPPTQVARQTAPDGWLPGTDGSGAATEQREARLLTLNDPIVPAPGAESSAGSRVAQTTQAPAIYVHIGRIDVRAVNAPAPKAPPAPSAMRMPSLAAHLRARDRSLGD